MNEQGIINQMKMEGYEPVYVWQAQPGELDAEHSHDFETKLYVLEGEINIKIIAEVAEARTFGVNEWIVVPKGQKHEGLAGKAGCKYVVGEKH